MEDVFISYVDSLRILLFPIMNQRGRRDTGNVGSCLPLLWKSLMEAISKFEDFDGSLFFKLEEVTIQFSSILEKTIELFPTKYAKEYSSSTKCKFGESPLTA